MGKKHYANTLLIVLGSNDTSPNEPSSIVMSLIETSYLGIISCQYPVIFVKPNSMYLKKSRILLRHNIGVLRMKNNISYVLLPPCLEKLYIQQLPDATEQKIK